MQSTTDPESTKLPMARGGGASNEIDLRDFISTVVAGKWVIFFVAVASTILSIAYVAFARPIYQADAVIQVEDDKPALSGLSDLTGVLPSDSAIGAEIEILRSRAILGEVVSELNLTTSISPIRFPLIGGAWSRLLSDVGPPPFIGRLSGYVWGNEVPKIRRFEVEGGGEYLELDVVALNEQEIDIFSSQNPVASGSLGETISFIDPISGDSVLINISGPLGRKGSRYKLIHKPKLAAILSLKSRLAVSEVGRETGIMRLRIEGPDPSALERSLNAIANTYLRQNVERRSAEAQQSLAFLSDQLPQVRAELEGSENKLAKFREKNKTIDLSIETESVLEKMVLLDQRLSELELKRAELTRNYTPDHPVVKTLDEQRAQLTEEKEKLEESSSTLPDVQQELLRLAREVEVGTQLYTYMLNRVQELRVVKAGTVGNVRIIDGAVTNPHPVKPRKKFSVVASFLSGVIVSLIFLIGRRMFRLGITDPNELERILEVPVYAVLPFNEEISRRKSEDAALVVSSAPTSIVSEAFRSLRTSVFFGVEKKQHEAAIIAVSGPAPNVGKTFVSTNMAATLTESGKNVLYIDADLRRGDADSKLGVRRQPGLSSALLEPEVNVIQSCPYIQGLSVVPRGKSPPNPAELFMDARFSVLLDDWKKKYDFIIIDTPPVLAVTDPVIIGKYVDALFLVGRAGKTAMHELVEAKNRFERTGVPVKGVIVNGMTKGLSSGGQYGSGYGYYNYSYTSSNEL